MGDSHRSLPPPLPSPVPGEGTYRAVFTAGVLVGDDYRMPAEGPYRAAFAAQARAGRVKGPAPNSSCSFAFSRARASSGRLAQ